MVIEQDAIDHFRDRHLHTFTCRELNRARRRDDALGDGLLSGACLL